MGSNIIEIVIALVIFSLFALHGSLFSLKCLKHSRQTLHRCEKLVAS